MTAPPSPGSAPAPGRIQLEAPAKINLYLEVVGRRPDGFHELVTVLQTIDLADRVELAVRERRAAVPAGTADVAFELVMPEAEGAAGPRAETDADAVPADLDNLAVRAAVDWLTAAGQLDRVGIDLRLTKRIPAGAGLGGGSSDAATVLLGLSSLLGTDQGPDLPSLAAGLGSDVAFFLVGGTALCLGRGEQVIPIAEPDSFELVLGFPDFPIPTPAVYGALDAPGIPASRPEDAQPRDVISRWDRRLAGATLDDLRAVYRNDLEAPACHVRSELVDLLDAHDIHLSGSGSTLFLFGSAPPPDASACRRVSMRFVRHRSRKR